MQMILAEVGSLVVPPHFPHNACCVSWCCQGHCYSKCGIRSNNACALAVQKLSWTVFVIQLWLLNLPSLPSALVMASIWCSSTLTVSTPYPPSSQNFSLSHVSWLRPSWVYAHWTLSLLASLTMSQAMISILTQMAFLKKNILFNFFFSDFSLVVVENARWHQWGDNALIWCKITVESTLVLHYQSRC